MRCDILKGKEIKCTSSTNSFCRLSDRDVSMASRRAGEFKRHFMSDSHWERDVTYRVHRNFPRSCKSQSPCRLSGVSFTCRSPLFLCVVNIHSPSTLCQSLSFPNSVFAYWILNGGCGASWITGLSSLIYSASRSLITVEY